MKIISNIKQAITLSALFFLAIQVNGQGIIWEKWNGNYNSLDPFPTSSPDESQLLYKMGFGSSIGDHYLSKYRGFIQPDTTGEYVFYICSDDQSRLYLSTDSTIGNKQLLCEEEGWNSYNDFSGAPKSDTILLDSGKVYYIEAIHREGTGGDHCQVAWTGPGITSPTVIDSSQFADMGMNITPSIDKIADQGVISNDAATQTLLLTGISAQETDQNITQVNASNANPVILKNVSVSYTLNEDSAVLSYDLAGGYGFDTISVLVKDDGGTAYGSSDSTIMSFSVEVHDTAMNWTPLIDTLNEQIVSSLLVGETQTIALTGIDDGDIIHEQSMSITAIAPANTVITNLAVDYTSDSTTGKLSYDITGTVGTVDVTVTLTDGAEGDISYGDNDSSFTFSINVYPPLPGGEYTIGIDGDYTTIEEAFTAIDNGGIGGEITFTLIDSVYDLGRIYSNDYGVEIGDIPGTSPTNTVTLKPASFQDSVVITSSLADHDNGALFLLNGVDYLTIDGSNNGTNSKNLTFILGEKKWYGPYYSIQVDAATNLTIKNVYSNDIKNGGTSYNSAYRYRSFVKINKGKNIHIENNHAINHFDGIIVNGSLSNIIDSVVIRNNYLGNSSDATWSIKSKAIQVSHAKDILIHGNKIVNISTIPASNWRETPMGIYLADGCINAEISANYINGVITHKSGYNVFTPQGIRIDHDTTGLVTIKNNVISGIKHGKDGISHNYISAISINNKMGPIHVYHNTIFLGDTVNQGSDSKSIKGIEINNSGIGSCDIRNNIFSMPYIDTSATPDKVYCIHSDNEFANDTVDYNIFYIDTTKSNNYICNAGGTTFSTLADYQSYTFASNIEVGANSHFAKPPFRGQGNFQIHPDSSFVGLDAALDLGVEKDFDGEKREASPDIGADEVLPLPAQTTLGLDSVMFEALNVSWNPATNALEYDIQISEGNDDFSTLLVNESGTFTSYQADDLVKSTDYYCRVRGTNITGNGLWSDTLLVTTLTPVDSINVRTSSGLALMGVDSTIQMIADIFPASPTEDSIAWSVLDLTGSASITADGELTANTVGKIKVAATATDGTGVSDTLNIEIYIPTKTITVVSDNGENSVSVGKSIRLLANTTPVEAWDSVSWSIKEVTGEGSLYVGIDHNNCQISGLSAGMVKIAATTTDGTFMSDTFYLTVIQPVTSILLSTATGDNIILVDSTVQMIADVSPSDATQDSIAWSVSNIDGQANINNTGELTANQSGEVKVFASATDGSGIIDSMIVEIAEPTSSITISYSGLQKVVGIDSTVQLNVSVQPSAAAQSVNWSVNSVSGNATIDDNGLLTGTAEGEITITATAKDGTGISDNFTFEVIKPVTSIAITGDTEININGTAQLTAAVTPTDATNSSVTWSIDNDAIATIDSTGKVTGVSQGTATVTATAEDVYAVNNTLVITVTDKVNISGIETGNIMVYPNPANSIINIEPGTDKPFNVVITDLSGIVLMQETNLSSKASLDISEINCGAIILTIQFEGKEITKRIIVE